MENRNFNPCPVAKGVSPDPETTRTELTQKRPLAGCLLYTSDAADERSSVDLGGRRIIKKKKQKTTKKQKKKNNNNGEEIRK